MKRPHSRLPRRLCFEACEDRRLLAIAAFDFQLYRDHNGDPGAPLVGPQSLEVNERFHVEVRAQEWDWVSAGLQGIALDIHWDPQVFALDSEYLPEEFVTDNLPLVHDGRLDADAGAIIDISGAAFPAAGAGRPIGNLGPDSFLIMPFRALDVSDGARFEMTQGQSGITPIYAAHWDNSRLDFEVQTVQVVAPILGSDEPAPSDSPLAGPEGLPQAEPPDAATIPVTESVSAIEERTTATTATTDRVENAAGVEGVFADPAFLPPASELADRAAADLPPTTTTIDAGHADAAFSEAEAMLACRAATDLTVLPPGQDGQQPSSDSQSHTQPTDGFADVASVPSPHEAEQARIEIPSLSNAERDAKLAVDNLTAALDGLYAMIGPIDLRQLRRLFDVLADQWLVDRGNLQQQA